MIFIKLIKVFQNNKSNLMINNIFKIIEINNRDIIILIIINKWKIINKVNNNFNKEEIKILSKIINKIPIHNLKIMICRTTQIIIKFTNKMINNFIKNLIIIISIKMVK